MTTRRRLTWTDRSAAAPAPQPPAVPGYEGAPSHPASKAQPAADAYETGDTSSWAEDVRGGPYPNSAAPALPGNDEPQGHPATDPKHYFPAGRRQARIAQRRLLERKAAQCIKIAERLLGKRASVQVIEAQATDLMNLADRDVTATLKRMADFDADGLVADDFMFDDDDLLAEDCDADCDPGVVSEDEILLAEMNREASIKSRRARQQAARRRQAAEDVEPAKVDDKGADAEDAEEEKVANLLLAKMLREERAKRARAKAAESEPASEDADDKEAEELLAEMVKEEAKKASRGRKAEDEKAPPVKAEEKAPPAKAEEKADDKKAKAKAADVLDDQALLDEMDAELSGVDPLDVDLDIDGDVDFNDPLDIMNDGLDGLSPEDENLLFANGRKAEAEEDAAVAEESPVPTDAEEKKAARLAAMRGTRTASAKGPKTIGPVIKASSEGLSDLEKLWRSDPDVSGFFGS